MDKKMHFSPASKKGHFCGLVDEGEYLRQSLLYKQILPRTPSRPKTSLISVAKNLFNQRNPRLINDLRLFKALYICRDSSADAERSLQIDPFLTNKANFQQSQMNVSDFVTTNYEQRTMNYEIKNKPDSNPIQTQYKANTNPIQTRFKPNSNPIQTQFILSKPLAKQEQTQFQRQKLLNFTINTRLESKKFHLILVLHHPILFNSGSNCEMDKAAHFANEGKMAAGQEGQQNFWTR